MVMLEGPTLSGKTSLVQLLGKKADESKHFSRVISLSPVNGDEFQREISTVWNRTWKELISSTPEGTFIQAPPFFGESTDVRPYYNPGHTGIP